QFVLAGLVALRLGRALAVRDLGRRGGGRLIRGALRRCCLGHSRLSPGCDGCGSMAANVRARNMAPERDWVSGKSAPLGGGGTRHGGAVERDDDLVRADIAELA